MQSTSSIPSTQSRLVDASLEPRSQLSARGWSFALDKLSCQLYQEEGVDQQLDSLLEVDKVHLGGRLCLRIFTLVNLESYSRLVESLVDQYSRLVVCLAFQKSTSIQEVVLTQNFLTLWLLVDTNCTIGTSSTQYLLPTSQKSTRFPLYKYLDKFSSLNLIPVTPELYHCLSSNLLIFVFKLRTFFSNTNINLTVLRMIILSFLSRITDAQCNWSGSQTTSSAFRPSVL